MANLRESALLIHQRTRQFTGRKLDKRIRDAAVSKHGVKDGALRGGEKLLVGDKLDAIQSLYGAASREHIARTAPWMDSGPRIMAAAGYQDYMTAFRTVKDGIDSAVEDFMGWYSREYSNGMLTAQAELNGLFEWGDYPMPGMMRRRFVLEAEVLPFPDAQDFRVDLGAGEVGRIKAQIERSINVALDAAMGDVWERVRDTVGKIATVLPGYTGGKAGAFHDTLIGNLRELIVLLPGLNVTGDTRAVEIGAMMAELLVPLPAAGVVVGKDDGAAALRENDRLRAETAAAADAILAKMADFV